MRILLSLLLALAVPAASAFAQSRPRGFAKDGMYVGASFLPGFTLDGRTFDGETLYQEVDGDEIGLLPKLDTQNMLRVVLGFKARVFALEFSYERTNHTGTFVDIPVEANFNSVNVDGKIFFLTRRMVQPHVVVGLAFPWLNVIDGASDGTTVGDARWRGPGLNTEGGVTWRATGVSGTVFELEPPFKETSGSPIMTAFYTF